MADTLDEVQLLQQEKTCKKDLINQKILPDEYLCCILSLYGYERTFVCFPALVQEFSLTNPSLHAQLTQCYETFYAQSQVDAAAPPPRRGNDSVVNKSDTHHGIPEPDCELAADLDLELAIQLSLKEVGGGSDIYEPAEADLVDYAGWTTAPSASKHLQTHSGNEPIVFNGLAESRTTKAATLACNTSTSHGVKSRAQKLKNKRVNAWETRQVMGTDPHNRQAGDGAHAVRESILSKPSSSNFVFEKQTKKHNGHELKSAKKSVVSDFASKSILDMLKFPNPRVHMEERDEQLTYHNSLIVNTNNASPSNNHSTEVNQPKKKKKNKKNNKKYTDMSIERRISTKPVIYWLRRDLRLYDNPALVEACMSSAPVIPVFIWSEREEGPAAAGGATKLWLHHALTSLNHSFQTTLGSQIMFYKASSCCVEELRRLVGETGAGSVVWSDQYEPALKKRDDEIDKALQQCGVEVKRVHSYLLYEPSAVNMESIGMRGIGSVTHFMEACRQSSITSIRLPVDTPPALPLPATWPPSHTLDQLQLHKMPRRKNGQLIDWAAPMVASWDFSEDAAYDALQLFLSDGVRHYEKESGRSDKLNTCKISPYLHFGQISPHTILAEAKHRKCPKFLRKLAWRDLSYFLLHMFPTMDSVPLRPHYRLQRWSSDVSHIKAWQRGRTGYPLVDAAMRELWLTGWMNNYMRHVVASFLISYLHLHWVVGYKWFQDTLFDADVAINAMMWQNGGMSGLDHWNFVMHPVDAALTCDPQGDYMRRWVPELAALPNEFIAQPWKCPPSILRRAGVQLGQTYPERVITDLDKARDQSLQDAVDVRCNHGDGWIDRHGNDMVPLPNGMKIPVITRREFKYKTANPHAVDNPHTAVLRGYRSRGRDELIAFEKQVDFLASTMDESLRRNERLNNSANSDLIY